MVSTSDYSQRFAEAMRLSGLTAHDIAKAVGISYQAVKKILVGTSGMLTAENNSVAAKAMGVNSDWLATGTARPPVLVHSPEADALAALCDRITDQRERKIFVVAMRHYGELATEGRLEAALDLLRLVKPAPDTMPGLPRDQSSQTAASQPSQTAPPGPARLLR